jgi:ribosomal protein S21
MTREYYESLSDLELARAAMDADRDVKKRNCWCIRYFKRIWNDEMYLRLLKKADMIDEIQRKRRVEKWQLSN